jgi:hypothetical protein
MRHEVMCRPALAERRPSRADLVEVVAELVPLELGD